MSQPSFTPSPLPALLVCLSLCLGCGDETSSGPAQDPAQDNNAPGQNNDPVVNNENNDPSPDAVPEPVSGWCEAGFGGAPGQRAFAQDFAHAHVSQRLFGPGADWAGADDALAELLEGSQLDAALLDLYADAFEDVCVGEANDIELAPTLVEVVGGVALVRPGEGAPVIPETAEVVAVDLRALPEGADLEAALSAALDAPLVLGQRKVRRFQGFPSQDDEWTHYESGQVEVSVELDAGAERSRPLVLLTGKALGPEAATYAAGLRLLGRAALVGHDVHVRVAESSWTGIEGRGLLWRSSTLGRAGQLWPDVVSTDLLTDDPEAHLEALADLAEPEGLASRSELAVYRKDAEPPSAQTLGPAQFMTGLLVAYGTLDRFYTYFGLVGRGLDEALLTALTEASAAPAGDRRAYMRILGAFMNALDDGHGFYSDWDPDAFADGYIVAQIQRVDGKAVVRVSDDDALQAGDTIIEIDGVAADDWYEDAMGRYSASTEGYRFVQATDLELAEIFGARRLRVLGADGQEREAIPTPRDYFDTFEVPWGGTFRPNGPLDDLGAADIHYINLSGNVSTDDQTFELMETIGGLTDVRGLILDMRDYPDVNYYDMLRVFFDRPFTAAIFGHPTWTGAEDFEIFDEVWDFTAGREVYDGPIAVLTSNKSVSSAEHICQILAQLDNVTFVGQLSAGTNGTVTSAWLPGSLRITFTGMDLRNPDGTDFHGIGIVPDIEVVPTPADFAAGLDPELGAAVNFLRGQ